MNKAMKIVLTVACAVTMAGATVAQGTSYVCAYVNDNAYGPNIAEGYKIGPGNAGSRVGPYFTNGTGIDNGYYAGGLAATRGVEGDLYVEDSASDNITHFMINKADCTLTLDTTLYPSGDTNSFSGDPLAITPDGLTMFVGSGDFHIYSHTIAANGSLGATFTEASTPDNIAGIEVSPDGTTLVVSNADIGQVCAYPISSGHLGTPNCQSTASTPFGISIDPNSACVYVGAESGSSPAVEAFPLTGGVLGSPTDYNPFGPGSGSESVLVNWDNKAIYVSNTYSAQMTIGSIAPSCKLNYEAIISDGVGIRGQIAQAKAAPNYVVTGGISGTPHMGIFQAHVNGYLTPIGSGQRRLRRGETDPVTVVIIGVE
jgi:hypothetical protein